MRLSRKAIICIFRKNEILKKTLIFERVAGRIFFLCIYIRIVQLIYRLLKPKYLRSRASTGVIDLVEFERQNFH